ncbi:putative zinc metalloproteinase nas-13-like [Apostichopus japonicus]|uniref:Metalloendopeptidase n=1 Tax=Stichopus japonicus TaxID=307972 RepID=A0A2G8L8X9_STIJA|nr:putative zinc metalloproteinase nas-13-like [Apostichopus japonicus]
MLFVTVMYGGQEVSCRILSTVPSTPVLDKESLPPLTVTTNNLYSVYSLEWTKRLRHIVPRQGCFSALVEEEDAKNVGWGACNFHRGTIMHELMHAVGFQHEQTRTDRDQFVTVYYQNIQSGLEYNFVRYNQDTIDHLQTRYDYYSIMHYPMNAFSRNGRPTIVPRQAGVSIGNRNDFSATDILKINRYYGCEDTTETEGDETNPDCEETHPNCSAWAARGECSRNPAWMLPNCPVSCQQCRRLHQTVQTTTSTVRGGRVTESVREIHCI